MTGTAGAVPVAVGPVGDNARALAAVDPVGVEATVDARSGDLLVRVTARRPDVDPLPDALAMTRGIVAAG